MTEETLSTCVSLINQYHSMKPKACFPEWSALYDYETHTLMFLYLSSGTDRAQHMLPFDNSTETNVTQNVMLSHRVKAVRGNLAELKDCRQGSKTDLGSTLGWSVFPSSVQYGENEVTLLLNYNSLIN